ncbi:MAG: TonB-dependent receptor [Rhodocyclales bacterium]|nr:TonB-dependent receptor [Rhodocyclales bacterium]
MHYSSPPRCGAPRRRPIALAIAAAFSLASHFVRAEAEAAATLPEMSITASQPAVPANLPNTVEGITARQIDESINAVTTGSVLQNLPSVHVRERYIGDRNGILVMRVNSSIASAQTAVYADNLLVSNFLNNSFSTPPRWGMVAPEEIDRVDVVYGPFSAMYPGNSAGGVVVISAHMPEKFEAHAKLDVFGQHFKMYGTDQSFNGRHGSVSLGNKSDDWSFWLNLDHLDNHGHPQTFGNATKGTAGATPVTVVDSSKLYRDVDTAGNPRIIVSSTGIDHTVQDNGKFKLAYDFAPSVRATYTLGIWQNKSDGTVDSYLRDATGRTVYNAGSGMANPLKFVRIDGVDYTVSTAAPSRSESEHWMHGLALKTSSGGTWDWEAVASLYKQVKETVRTAVPTSGYDSGLDAVRPGGTLKVDDGTGWRTLDLRGEWRPGGDRKSEHQLSFGYHYDRYLLSSDTFTVTTDWLTGGAGALSSNSKGRTQTQALYLQDAWQFARDWKLTAGLRMESWKASSGSNFATVGGNVSYQDRGVNAFSPKASLSFQTSADWVLRGSAGKATRFPTVSELFANIGITVVGSGAAATAGQIAGFPAPYNSAKTNNPNLGPESVNSWEFTAERALGEGLWRTSVFWEDKRDALVSTSDITTLPGFSISAIQNIDQIRTRGVETALQTGNLWQTGLDLMGSVTYANSKILRSRLNPGLVGSDQPRIPDWRATLVATWHASDALSWSLSYRFSGRQHNALINTATGQYNDPNPDVYGAVSKYTVIDTKVLYKADKHWTAAVGINNLANYKYFVNPNPYPERTYFASLKYDY